MLNGEEAPEKRKNRKRTGYFKVHEIQLAQKGIEVRAYDKNGDFVGRLEINRAGLEAFVGPKGNTSICDLSWEKLFDRLAEKEKK